ncbi:MAG: YfcE family phosphodiesterase [bacterium]
MKIGVISDTHSKIPSAAFDLLKDCVLILHAGDIGNFTIINDLKEIIKANVVAVKGNCDNFSLSEYPNIQSFTINGFKIFMTHDLDRVIPPDDANIIIAGHTHRPLYIKNDLGNIIVNPGACGGSPRGEIKNNSIAIINLEKGNLFAEILYLP